LNSFKVKIVEEITVYTRTSKSQALFA